MARVAHQKIGQESAGFLITSITKNGAIQSNHETWKWENENIIKRSATK